MPFSLFPAVDTGLHHGLLGVEERLRGQEDYHSPIAWRRLLVDSGIPALDLPERVGGQAWPAARMADIFAFCGSISLDLRDVPGAGHARLLLCSSSRAHDNVLRGVAEGREFVAVAITEEQAGSDLHSIETRAEPVPGGYVLNGEKRFVARLAQASKILVFARSTRSSPRQRLTVFLVARDAPGVSCQSIATMGLHGVSFGTVSFRDCFLPGGMRVGGEGEGFSLFLKHFTYWRAAMAAAAIGCARSAIDETIHWLRTRHAFGGPIGRFSHLQQELAQHVAKVHMAWLLVISVMERIDQRQAAFTDAAMAKAEALDACVAAVSWAVRTHGARGYCADSNLEKRLRDLLGLQIADGTSDVLRGQVSRAVLGNDLYEMSLGRREGGSPWKLTRRFW
jgi:alkylation response protein AidB-like acyl-CoA dehydrogenase